MMSNTDGTQDATPETPSTKTGRELIFYSATSKRVGFLRSLLTSLLTALIVCLAWNGHARGLPAQEDILNFGKVSEHLYRGAQPDADGLKSLKTLGVKLIVNLRMPGDGWKEEAAEAAANGILYTNFPMTGTTAPSDDQVKQILALFESFSDPIFVHCQHGCDRTGTIVACYRIQHDHWTSDLALREARHYGISPLEFLMKRYVASFAQSVKPEQRPDLREAKAK
jgi:protein tyrosine/serine phosphatase